MARAAATFMASLISLARTSRAPRKMPGKARTLLTWLGKSLRPVDTTAAPPALASSGKISGTGLAQAKIMGSLAMVCTISLVSVPGAETPMNTSAPRMTSARVPVSWLKLVMRAISSFTGLRPSRPS